MLRLFEVTMFCLVTLLTLYLDTSLANQSPGILQPQQENLTELFDQMQMVTIENGANEERPQLGQTINRPGSSPTSLVNPTPYYYPKPNQQLPNGHGLEWPAVFVQQAVSEASALGEQQSQLQMAMGQLSNNRIRWMPDEPPKAYEGDLVEVHDDEHNDEGQEDVQMPEGSGFGDVELPDDILVLNINRTVAEDCEVCCEMTNGTCTECCELQFISPLALKTAAG